MNHLMDIISSLADATHIDLIPAQYSRNRSANMMNQISQCIIPYDSISGLPLSSVNLSVSIASSDITTSSIPLLDDIYNNNLVSVTIPLNDDIFISSPAFTITSIHHEFIENQLNISSGTLLSDIIHIDIGNNINSIGTCNNQANQNDNTDNNLIILKFPRISFSNNSTKYKDINTTISCKNGIKNA